MKFSSLDTKNNQYQKLDLDFRISAQITHPQAGIRQFVQKFNIYTVEMTRALIARSKSKFRMYKTKLLPDIQ